MAQGEFTKEEATASIQSFSKVVTALTKKKVTELHGQIGDISAFLASAKDHAPSKKAPAQSTAQNPPPS